MAEMQFEFAAGGEQLDLFGSPAGQPESQPEAPSEAGEAAEPPCKRRRSDGKSKKEEKICCICEEQPAVPKFTYCKECKKDVQSCLNNAKQEGKEEDFRRLSKTAAGLKHLICHYKSKCPSRGQGVPRDKMDWVAYLSSVFSENRVVNGTKEVFMDFPDFETHLKSKGKTAKEAMEEWSNMEATDHEHDYKGRRDFEKRFAIAVEEYRLKENVTGDRQDCSSKACVFPSFQVLNGLAWQLMHDGVIYLILPYCYIGYSGL